jgi:integrase
LSSDEINELYNAIFLGRNVLRDKAIITLFLTTAIRLDELNNIKMEDMDFENGFLVIQKGKGNKQ